jgi:ankyrin repeat protein
VDTLSGTNTAAGSIPWTMSSERRHWDVPRGGARRDLVRLLLDHGADPNVAGAEWATPLAWAEKKGHRDIARDLRAAGAQ